MLYLWLDDDGMRALQWRIRERDGSVVAAGGDVSLEAVAAQATGRPATVLLPTRHFAFTQVELPLRRRRQAMAAIPFTVEERLAQDLDRCHFVHGDVDAEGRMPVLVVDRERVGGWLEALRGAGVRPVTVVPDLFLLPWSPPRWSALAAGDRVVVRSGEHSGFETDAGLAPELLARSLRVETGAEVAPLRLWSDRPGTPAWAEAAALEVEPEGNVGELLARYADSDRPGRRLNLLQGPFAPRDADGPGLRRWWPAAALLLVWLAVEMALVGLDLRALGSARAELEQQATRVFRQVMPDAKGVRDAQEARARLEIQLRQLRGGAGDDASSLLNLLAAAAPVVTAFPEATVTRLSYRDRALTIDLTLPTLQAVEELRARLEGAGLAAKVETASAQDGVVTGRLSVEGAGT